MNVNVPAFTSNPPQIHHQKTTFCTPFLPKPPTKRVKPAPEKITALRWIFESETRRKASLRYAKIGPFLF